MIRDGDWATFALYVYPDDGYSSALRHVDVRLRRLHNGTEVFQFVEKISTGYLRDVTVPVEQILNAKVTL